MRAPPTTPCRPERIGARVATAILLATAAAALPVARAGEELGEVDCRVGRPPPIRVGAPESNFDSPQHGWTSSDGDDALFAEGGQLIVHDIREDWLWLTASSNFHGSWDRIARIELRVRADAKSDLRFPAIIELSGGGSTATFELHKRFFRAGEWADVSIPLDPALWTTQGSWGRVIDHVERVRVRLDLDARTDAREQHLLAHFRAVPEPLSDFAENNQGWTCTGGILDEAEGAIAVRDTGSGWCWLRAPRAFQGDLRRYRALEIRLRSEGPRAPDQPLRVQIESGTKLAFHQVAPETIGARRWVTLRIPLDADSWARTGSWDELIANVSDVYVRADLIDHRGRDEVARIASVRLVEH